MQTFITKQKIGIGVLFIGVAVVVSLVASAAMAAPPQKVTFHGKRIASAVIGKSATMKFRVKNTSDVTYSGVKVTFHVPEGLTSTTVAPANAVIEDDLIYWENVPLEPGQSFYPTLTFTVDSDTPAKKKLNIWVEVTGDDMEATSTNFSITTKKK